MCNNIPLCSLALSYGEPSTLYLLLICTLFKHLTFFEVMVEMSCTAKCPYVLSQVNEFPPPSFSWSSRPWKCGAKQHQPCLIWGTPHQGILCLLLLFAKSITRIPSPKENRESMEVDIAQFVLRARAWWHEAALLTLVTAASAVARDAPQTQVNLLILPTKDNNLEMMIFHCSKSTFKR